MHLLDWPDGDRDRHGADDLAQIMLAADAAYASGDKAAGLQALEAIIERLTDRLSIAATSTK